MDWSILLHELTKGTLGLLGEPGRILMIAIGGVLIALAIVLPIPLGRWVKPIQVETAARAADAARTGNSAVATAAPHDHDHAHDAGLDEVPLDEAIKYALTNGKVLRSLGARAEIPGFSAGTPTVGDQILNNPDFARTVFDPAIQESSPGFSPFTK